MGTATFKYFSFEHLPDGPLKNTSVKFYDLACQLEAEVKDGPEKSAGMRKLLEAKDCFVRAALED